jgi:hypothetical protein
MPANRWLAVQQKFTATFYWIGVTMSVLCFALAWARNTELISRFSLANFPLPWAAGLIAIVAFLVAEYCHPPSPAKECGAHRLPETLSESSALETEFVDS